MNEELVNAYRETEYRVRAGKGFVLRIGQRCAELAALHAEFGVLSSGYVTAFNPFSLDLPATENARRQEELRDAAFTLGLRFLEGVGQHPSNGWPGEDSILILGVSLGAARVLAAQFGQNAFVWAGAQATPDLVLMR